jgi:hypothetical protein
MDRAIIIIIATDTITRGVIGTIIGGTTGISPE